VSFGKTLNAVSHFEAKRSTVVVAQPNERHANRTASVLEWYDRHSAYAHTTTSGSNEVVTQIFIYRNLEKGLMLVRAIEEYFVFG